MTTPRALLGSGRRLQSPELLAARREDLRRRRAAVSAPLAAGRLREPRSSRAGESVELFEGLAVFRSDAV